MLIIFKKERKKKRAKFGKEKKIEIKLFVNSRWLLGQICFTEVLKIYP
jgi:hypothetical protein